jgi:hypothetical protein
MGSHACAAIKVASEHVRVGPDQGSPGFGVTDGRCAELLRGRGLEELDRVAGGVVPELKTGGAEPLGLGGHAVRALRVRIHAARRDVTAGPDRRA